MAPKRRIYRNFHCQGEIYGVTENQHIPHHALKNIVSSTSIVDDCPLFACKFAPSASNDYILGTCNENGTVGLYDTRRSENSDNFLLKEFSAHKNAAFDLTWISDQGSALKLVTASADHTATLWDCQTGAKLATFAGHEASVRSVSGCPNDSNAFTTSGRDGHVLVWDIRNQARTKSGIRPVNSICNAHAVVSHGTSQSTVAKVSPVRIRQIARKSAGGRLTRAPVRCSGNPITSILYHDAVTVISGSFTDSKIRCWDLRKTYTFFHRPPVPCSTFTYVPAEPVSRQCGFSCFCTDIYRSSLFALCTDGFLYEYSLTASLDKPVAQYKIGFARSFYIKCATMSSWPFVVCGSGDGCAYGFSLNNRNRGDKCSFVRPTFSLPHTSNDEVTSVACNGRSTMVTCADDRTWRVWRLRLDEPGFSVDGDHSTANRPINLERLVLL